MQAPENADADERFDAIFDHAVDLPEAERADYLDEVCAGDANLHRQLEELLAAEANRQEFMDDPTVDTSQEDTADVMIGTRIGSYKLLQVLGEGGYGVVYLAEQRQPVKRRVALKVIKLGMDTRQVIARFEAERQALAMMDHPNIAKVFEAGATESGRPYFVMELVRGVPITEHCDHCKLPMEKRLALFIDVCRAVQHAHQKGVIHRDLKPNNILVTLHDGVPVAKVIDFGIAKATNIQLTDKTLFTDFRQFVGTPAYASPEQVEMSGLDVDTRSDIYSLGVLLYELLTGTTPVPVETLKKAAYAEIQRTILETDPPTPSHRLSTLGNARQLEVASARAESPNRLRQFLRGELDWILMKALEKDRERRYETANAFAQDIQHFLANEPITAGAPGVIHRLRKHARRNKTAAAIALALALGGMVSAWQAIRASKGELEARKNLYLADMNVAQDALDSGNMESAITILESHIPKRGQKDLRHWEWRYLWGQTHRELFTLIADDDPDDDIHPDGIFDLALSPDAKLLASAGRNGRIRLWDLTTQTQVFQFELPPGRYAWVDISPDVRHIVASTSYSKTDRAELVVWSVPERREVHRFSIAPSTFVGNPQFVSDTEICVGGSDGNVWFHDLETGETQTFKQHVETVIGTSVTGKYVATSSKDRVNVWDAVTKRVLTTLEMPEPQVRNRAVLSPDARWISSSRSLESRVTIYERDTVKIETEIYCDFGVETTGFNQDGSLLMTSEIDGTIRQFDTKNWKERSRYHLRTHQLNDAVVSEDGTLIIAGGDNGAISGWPGTPPRNDLLEAHGTIASKIKYSPDGRLLAVGTTDGRVELWAADSKKLLFETPPRDAMRVLNDTDFDFSPDSRRLAVSILKDGAYSVALWDLVGFEQTATLEHDSYVNELSYSRDGKLLATGSRSGIRLWDVGQNQIAKQFGRDPIECLAFSPDGRLLASKAWDNEGIRIWEVASGDGIALLDEHIEPIGDTQSLIFSSDGKILASGGYDCQVILWDTDNWKPVRRLLGHQAPIWALAFSPDGKRLASAGEDDNSCRLWDVASGRELARFSGLTLDFSPDGNTLAVGGEYLAPGAENDRSPGQSTVRSYRAPTFEEIAGER